MTSDLLGHRVEGYRYDLVDLRDQLVDELPAALDGGAISRSVYGSPRDTATVPTVLAGAQIDWMRHRVRISYVLADHAPVPLLTGVVSAPVEDHTASSVTAALDLADKTAILAGDQFPGGYGVPAGADVLATVRTVIASTGDTTGLIADGTETLVNPMTWDAGTTKLQIVNDLLDAGGYFALACDGMGRFVARTYTAAEYRGTAWEFPGGYLPDFPRDRGNLMVPNRFVAVSRSDDPDTPALVATATDINGPNGYTARGRWITVTETDIEATSQDVLERIAARKLATAQQTSDTIEITHPWLPIDLNDVVKVHNPRFREPFVGVVQRQEHRLSPGGLITSTVRGIR